MKLYRSFILFIALAGCGGSKSVIESMKDENPISAKAFYADYTNGNIAAADAKYLNKTLKVSGSVLDVEQNGSGYAIGIETGPNVFPNGRLKAAIYFEMSNSDREKIAAIKDWDQMVIIGKCSGMSKDSSRMGGVKITFTNSIIESHKNASGK